MNYGFFSINLWEREYTPVSEEETKVTTRTQQTVVYSIVKPVVIVSKQLIRLIYCRTIKPKQNNFTNILTSKIIKQNVDGSLGHSKFDDSPVNTQDHLCTTK